MKILQVVHNFPPEFRGGVERTVELASAGLEQRGHEVAVICGSETREAAASCRSERWGEIPVWRMIRGPGLSNPIDVFDPHIAALYEEVLDQWRPDVVHVHHWWNLGDDLVRRATARGFPVALSLHDFFATCALFFRLPDGESPCELDQGSETCGPCVGDRFGIDAAIVARWIPERAAWFAAEIDAAAWVVAPSRSHADLLARFVGSDRRIDVVPLCSPKREPAPRSGTPFPEGPLRLFHHGHLSRVKGVEILTRAVELADPAGDRIALTLLGDLMEADLEIGRARHLAGDFDAAALRAGAADSDLAVYPSLARETYGLAVDEALQLGLPVIVSDRGAPPERIGSRGRVVSGGSPQALAACLSELLADPAIVAAMRSAAPPPILSPLEHSEALEAGYAVCRARPLPSVDLEGPLRARVARFQGLAGEIMRLLKRDGAQG